MDELPLMPEVTLQPFEKWAIDFVDPIQPEGKKTGAQYIITTTEYLTSALIEEFQLYHHKSTPYHLSANGMIEAFNKILESTLMKVCNAQRNDWDVHIPAVLWAYKTTCKKPTGQIPFRLVYGIEVVMPMEYIVPSPRIMALTGMVDHGALENRLA
eukprot:PITA_03655